jgi:hypothetical protein
MRQLKCARLAGLIEQALALAEQDRERELADFVDEARGEQGMHELGAALGDEGWAVLLFQFRDIFGGIVLLHRTFPAQVGAFARRYVLCDPVECLGDVVSA